jgi:hypothetical protein
MGWDGGEREPGGSNKAHSGSESTDREGWLGCGVREDGSQAGEEERHDSGMGVVLPDT